MLFIFILTIMFLEVISDKGWENVHCVYNIMIYEFLIWEYYYTSIIFVNLK